MTERKIALKNFAKARAGVCDDVIAGVVAHYFAEGLSISDEAQAITVFVDVLKEAKSGFLGRVYAEVKAVAASSQVPQTLLDDLILDVTVGLSKFIR